MSVNTQLTVGVHVLCLLAGSPGQPVTSEHIAGSVNTNPVVIRRVLGRLRKAGMVRSRGGAKGGWELIQPATSITLRTVMEATGPFGLLGMHRDAPNPKCDIGAGVQQVLRGVYDKAETALRESLGRVTIADVLGAIREAPALARV
jgi:Rrf2 family protein